MAKHFVRLALLVMLATQSIAAQQSKPAVSEVPFSLIKGFVVVEAKIKGNGPVHVILATGTENSVTDPSFLKKYDLSAGYAADGPVTGRNDKTYDFAIVKDVSVGESKSSMMRMRFGWLSDVSDAVGQEIFATLGDHSRAGRERRSAQWAEGKPVDGHGCCHVGSALIVDREESRPRVA